MVNGIHYFYSAMTYLVLNIFRYRFISIHSSYLVEGRVSKLKTERLLYFYHIVHLYCCFKHIISSGKSFILSKATTKRENKRIT